MVFQKIVLTIATILLIILLIIIGFMAWGARNQEVFPPIEAECPDYWIVDPSGNCVNKQGLGKDSCPRTMDFSGAEYKGDPGLQAKCKWARSCDLTWDGITNNPTACNPSPAQN